MKNACIVPLSGGLDSTGVLLHLLRTRPDDNIYVFHINIIKDVENYHIQEQRAVFNIIDWCVENFPGRVVDVRYPTIDLRNFPNGLDSDQVMLFAQKFSYGISMLEIYNNIQLFIGLVKDDRTQWMENRHAFNNGVGINATIWQTLLDSMIGRVSEKSLSSIDRTVYYPLKEFTKSEIIKNMPIDLLGCVWYCRTPKNNKPCNDCVSCKTHMNALKEAIFR